MGTESETVLTEYFPKKPQTGDVYFQRTMGSRLIYTYNRGGEYGAEWSVVADRDCEPKYDEIGILSKIAGKPVTSMYKAFENHEILMAAPKIPSTITNMGDAFFGCQELQEAPVIPSSVTSLNGTFRGCRSLTTAPVIPGSVMDMTCTFEGCINLTGVVEINANPTSYDWCFYGTAKPIKLSGTSKILNELARHYNNITVAG